MLYYKLKSANFICFHCEPTQALAKQSNFMYFLGIKRKLSPKSPLIIYLGPLALFSCLKNSENYIQFCPTPVAYGATAWRDKG